MGISGIRPRVRLAVVLPALSVALAVVFLVARDRLELLEQRLAAETALAGEQWKESGRRAMQRGDRATMRAILESTAARSGIAMARIVNAEGAIALSVASDLPGTLLATPGDWLIRVTALRPMDAAPVRVALADVSQAGPRAAEMPPVFGWLELVPDTTAGKETFLLGMLPVLGLVLGLLIVTLLVADWLAASIRAPLVRLTEHVGQIRFGHLNRRVSTSTTDELGTLAAAINRMASALARSERNLDQKVRQTTAELHQTLRAVESQNVELDVARRRALEASNIKSEFLANVSHEIRTPINGIVGFVDLLDGSRLDTDQRDYVTTIRESCINLLGIVNDVLDFSKLDAGKLVIDSVPFDFRDLLDDVLSLLAPSAYGKGLELSSMVYADVPVRLYGDPTRIRQIITNLTHNAIKFTGEGAVAVRLMVVDDNDAEATVRVQVTDSGIGLDEREREKLFQPFVQVDSSPTRRFGGTGLGLIICRKLVEQMRGDIGVDSESGQGAAFWFSLTLKKQPGGVEDVAPRWLSPLQGRRILVLDSQPLSRLSTQHLLTAWEVDVDTDAVLSVQSLDAAGSEWDAAVLGLTRPELGQGEYVAVLEHLRDSGIPVLVLASTVARNELRQPLHHGAGATLPKAVRRQTIYRELCRLLDPASDPPEASTPTTAEQPSPVPTGSRDEVARSRACCRVLVVDDNAINRKLMTTIAGRAGADVEAAVDGEEAVAACQRTRFDLVFMDLHMPGMDGEAATREILDMLGEHAAPRIVGLTANASRDIRRTALAAGMMECLVKPVGEDYLATLIDASAKGKGKRGPDNESALRDEMRRLLVAELPDHRQRVRHAYRSGDLRALREAVHKLHGGLAVSRLPELRELCRRLESAIDSDERPDVPGMVARLLTGLAELERSTPGA